VRIILVCLLAASALAIGAPAGAAEGGATGIGVEPGVWEFSSSLPDPSSGEIRRFTHRECVRDRLITPARVMARMKECRIWNARFQKTSARWSMRCDTPAGPISGGGSLRSNGTKIAGTLEMSYAIGGFEIPFSSPFDGRRVGNCR
jgi:hypothetical protein